MSLENVDSYLARTRARHLASLVELLRIPSVSAKAECADDILACAEWLKGHLHIGITGGASTAEDTIDEVQTKLEKLTK